MTRVAGLRRTRSSSAGFCGFALFFAVACGGSEVKERPSGAGGNTGGLTGGLTGGTGGIDTTGGTGGSGNPPGGPCANLQCKQTTCPNKGTTSVSGVVNDPAGKVPLYNVVVYVPNEPLAPLRQGAACETCSGNFSGKPIAVALTDSFGRFKVEDMPVGDDIPLVIQVGKWRRQITVPRVAACTDTPITDTNLTRLPRNKTEGDLPKIAVAVGGSDALECLLRKIGIDESEFTLASEGGRVNLFAAYRAATTMQKGGVSVPLPTADSLWNSLETMMGYDMMLMACEGSDNVSRSAAQYAAVRSYADQGGRIFGSHYHNGWINPENAPYPMVVKFASGAHGFTTDITTQVDDTFPKGKAFKEWLVNVGASSVPGEIVLKGAEHTVDTVVAGVAQRWIHGTDTTKNTPMVQYFSFTTPVGQKECGRMVFSDLHVSTGSGDTTKVPFPTGCNGNELSPQEKALAFMLFDLSSCVQKDDQPPVPPPIIVK
jgi:hypothetical protein